MSKQEERKIRRGSEDRMMSEGKEKKMSFLLENRCHCIVSHVQLLTESPL